MPDNTVRCPDCGHSPLSRRGSARDTAKKRIKLGIRYRLWSCTVCGRVTTRPVGPDGKQIQRQIYVKTSPNCLYDRVRRSPGRPRINKEGVK